MKPIAVYGARSTGHEQAGKNQAKDASVEAPGKPLKRDVGLLVLSTSSLHCFDDVQRR